MKEQKEPKTIFSMRATEEQKEEFKKHMKDIKQKGQSNMDVILFLIKDYKKKIYEEKLKELEEI